MSRRPKKVTPPNSSTKGKSTDAGSRFDWKAAGVCLFLVAVIFAVFGQALHFGFLDYDDDQNIYGQPGITSGISPQGVVWAFTHTQVGRWVPLTAISHQVDCSLFSSWAGGHHLTNILLHAFTAILVFLVLRKLTGLLWRSAFVAAVFALHPLHVEPVAWLSGRGELLGGLFFMLGLWSYLSYARQPQRRSAYFACIIWFVLGLLSKPMVVTFPFVLLLLDFTMLQRNASLPRLLIEKIPLFALAAALSIATAFVSTDDIRYTHPGLLLRLENALISYSIYFGKTLWPSGLAVFYPNPTRLFPAWQVIAAVILPGLIFAAAFGLRKKYPALLPGWLWFAGMLVPVIGIAQVSDYARADRYMYLPQIGLVFAITWFVADLSARWPHRGAILMGLAAVILPALLFAAHRQASYWSDSSTLWVRALDCTRDNFMIRNNYGYTLFKSGRTEQAIAQYREALRINPEFELARNNLGNAFMREGRTDEAIAEFREALKIDPHNGEAHDNLGIALASVGNLDGAIAEYRESVRIDPTVAARHYNLSNSLYQKGEAEEALAEAKQSAQLRPQNTLYQSNLAWILATAGRDSLRDAPKAVALATSAVQSPGGDRNPYFLRILAAALANSGDYAKAIQAGEQALRAAQMTSNMSLGQLIVGELRLYAAGQPLRFGK